MTKVELDAKVELDDVVLMARRFVEVAFTAINEAVNRWRQFWALPGVYRSIIIQTMVLLPLMGLGLRLLGFRMLRRWLNQGIRAQRPHHPSSSQDFTPSQQVVDWQARSSSVARLVWAAAAHSPCPWHTTCLQRSLVLWWLLQRRGVQVDLCIGVARHDDRLEAHAWVELNGQVLGDRSNIRDSFTPFTDPIP